MTLNQVGAVAGALVLGFILWHAYAPTPKLEPVKPAPIEHVEPKPEPKPAGKPIVHQAKGETYRQVLSGGRKGAVIRCASTGPVPANEIAEYQKLLGLTAAQVKTYRVCLN